MKEKLKFGLIGSGRIGLMHAKNITNLISEAEVVAVCDSFIDDIKRNELKKLGIEKIFKDVKEFIKYPDINAFFIASPTNSHIELIKDIILENNKPIFCEKPLSIKWEELVDLENLVRDKNTFLQLGYNRRFDSNFERVKKSIDDGEVGKQYLIAITSFDPEPPKAKFVKESGMIWTDMNIHDFDMIRNISGAEVENIFVYGSNLVSNELKGIDVDVSVINLSLSNGALAIIKTTRKSSYGYDQRIEVLGEKGRAKIENVRPTTFKLDTGFGRKLDNPYYTFIDRYPEAYVKEIQSFIDSLKNNSAPLVGIKDDLRALKISRAAEISYKENRIVKMEEIN